jgi:hypothetical protein
VRLVAEMRASLEQLAHGEIWQSHGVVLVRLSLGGSFEGEASLATGAGP